MIRRKPHTKTEPFVMLPRGLLKSPAWRTSGINVRRLVDYLLLEHMSHGGKENGNLAAPYRSLIAHGIGARLIPSAILDAEKRGLIRCQRGGLRVLSTYAITWLETADGKPAEHLWRRYNPAKSRNLHHEGEADLHHEGEADSPNLHHEGEADVPETLHHQGDDSSRRSYQGRGYILGSSRRRGAAVAGGSAR